MPRTPRQLTRCPWARTDNSVLYHDSEWGLPLYDEQRLFEFLILEGAQAGLSWETILAKRDNYRRAFDQFDPRRIARYNQRRINSLLADAGIVRNRLKIAAAIGNAQAYLRLREEDRTLSDYLWQFVDGQPRSNHWRTIREVPTQTCESDAMSKELKRRGFRFVGSTICYALMQATGMVNDHLVDCFRHAEVGRRKMPLRR
jgi:DNA-3-methyladenine glycosylase I